MPMFNYVHSPAARLLFSAFLMLGGAVASTDAISETRFYAGGGVISFDLFDRSCNTPRNNGGSHSFTITYRCEVNRETSRNVFVGYAFNRYWSAELGYLQADGFDYSGAGPYTTTAEHPAGESTGNLALTNATSDISILYLAGIGRIRLNDAFALTGRAGAYQWDYESCGTTSYTAATGTAPANVYSCKPSDGADLLYGIGADWDFTRRLRAQITLTRYEINRGDMDVAGVNLVYLF